MINLRYHIVSITAVFLALGIGLAFGAAFIDRATVDQLERNLNRIESDNTRLESANVRLEDRLEALTQIDAELRATGLSELVAGQLAEVPVATLAVRGIDEDAVAAASDATVAAGAVPAGVLWLTERFVLDDQSEIDDLAEALGVPPSSADGLHRIARRQLGALFARAAVPPETSSDTTTTTTTTTGIDEATTSTTAAIEPEPLPDLVQRLIDAGFLDYDPPAVAPVPPGPFAPSSGLRLLAISGEGAAVPDDVIMVPILDQVSGGAVAGEPGPVAVAAQRGPAFDPAPPEDADPAAARVVFVGPIRDDEDLRARLSTVDDLEAFPGLVATVLALKHGASGQYGHYGVGEGAQSLLPPPVDAGEAPG